MNQNEASTNLNNHVDWVVENEEWGTLSEACATKEEALELSEKTGGGAVYKRLWAREN
ncbi:hypothetical protein [Corynebacterium glutamicum]|uniref:hypothetical protein n=1 Tax=Corynebacterium glutamicum TaxID=1718 RepID=UPI000AE87326|nr:hypothetical protein [Corynebacterium glutamicum]